MSIRVQPLASLSGLSIQHCRELWGRSQMWLGSGIVVAVTVAGSCSSDLTPSLELSYATRVALKSKKKKKTNLNVCVIIFLFSFLFSFFLFFFTDFFSYRHSKLKTRIDGNYFWTTCLPKNSIYV